MGLRLAVAVLLLAMPQDSFEVASVRRNTSGSLQQGGDRSPGGNISHINVTLRDLVRGAYDLHDLQLVGGPDWFDRAHFDVLAKAPANSSDAQIKAMMRALLADRFKLVAHHEKRELPMFEVVLARADGKPGPGLRPRPDCAPGEVRESDNAPCGGALFGPGRLAVRGQPMADIVSGFARDRIVVDKTGLSGNFDVDLEWTPGPGELPSGGVSVGPPPPAGAPAMPAALEEQLGLRLRPTRAMVEVLVVDSAQQPSEEAAFDVASIRMRTPDPRAPGGAPRVTAAGRFQAPNATVRQLIAVAYELQDLQIINAPRWTGEDRFDIEATTTAGVTAAEARAMLRTLLVQRFGLTTHTETRELPVYALRTADADGRLGPQLQRSGPECRDLTMPRNVPAPPPPPPPPPSSGPPPILLGGPPARCFTLFVTMANSSHLTSRELTMERFAQRLTGLLGRIVINRTGLDGFYDVDLTYASESQAFAAGVEAPTLTTAVREQLGLRLESTRAPIDVLVIDRVEPPTDN